jgi:eukaryotic-like serine/threonine-protein kinase
MPDTTGSANQWSPLGPEVAGQPSPITKHRPSRYPSWVAAFAALIALTLIVLIGSTRGRDERPTALFHAGPPTPAGTQAPTGPATTPPTNADFPLPDGWRWYHDPGGFAVAVPSGWTQSRDDAMAYFRDPDGVRMLAVGRWQPSSADAVAAWTNEEADAARLTNYQRIRIEPGREYFRSSADWEYRYDGAGGRLHVIIRGFTTDTGRSYAINWRTVDRDWEANLPDFRLVVVSFQAG